MGESLAIGRINGDIAKSCCAVVLNVNVGGREEMHKHGNGAGIDKLLSVVI